jgi:superfamily I DNA and/or RNA helicase
MNSNWVKHTEQWLKFLRLRVATLDKESNKPEKIRINRQIAAIQNIRFAAVANPRLILKFINQECDTPAIKKNQDKKYYLKLNESQKNAVDKALFFDDLLLILGPPGTGKTQVITEICLELFEQNPNINILICSETHIAVNNLIYRVGENNRNIRLYRIAEKSDDPDLKKYSSQYIIETLFKILGKQKAQATITLNLRNVFNDDGNKMSLEKALMQSSNITGITCNRFGAFDFDATEKPFDYVIIDEVCKAMLPEILLPLAFAKKAILVGDPQQLPPVFCQEDIETIKLIEDCELQNYIFMDNFFNKATQKIILTKQYRMVNEIGTLISELFYNRKLENGLDNPGENSITWIDYQPTHGWPIDQTQIYNEDECNIIRQLVEQLDIKEKLSVAIISPYTNQVKKLKSLGNDYIKVDTVDGFQGKEADIVIFSITRTVGSLRFFSDPRRLNVAISRARKKLFIVGYKQFAEKKDNKLRDIIKRSKVEQYIVKKT